jgi:hypothetical protein
MRFLGKPSGVKNGGVLGKDNTPTNIKASGVWYLMEATNAIKTASWPTVSIAELVFPNYYLEAGIKDIQLNVMSVEYTDAYTNSEYLTTSLSITFNTLLVTYKDSKISDDNIYTGIANISLIVTKVGSNPL